MKKFLFLILVFPGLHAYATHRISSQIAVECLGTGLGGKRYYQVDITIFREILNAQAELDDPLDLAVYRLSDNTVISYQKFDITSRRKLSGFQNNQYNFEVAYYSKMITVEENFYLAMARCCRPPLNNLLDDIGSTTYTEVYSSTLESKVPSPAYNSPIVVSLHNLQTFDLSGRDDISDSTTYEITTPFLGGDKTDPKPAHADTLPYQMAGYKAGYSLANPLGNSNFLSMDRLTGLLSLRVNTTGVYAIGITVTKYKGGIKLYKQVRDLTIYSCVNCASIGMAIDPYEIQNNELTIYLNPTENVLNLQADRRFNKATTLLCIYNVEGGKVREMIYESGDLIHIEDLPAGIYFIELRNGNNRSYSKFCKI